MSQNSILTDLSGALDSREFESVRELLNQLENNYLERQRDRKRLRNQSSALYEDSTEISASQSTILFNTVQKGSSRRLGRVILIFSVRSLLTSLDQLSDKEVNSAIDDIQSIISEMQVSENEFETAVEQSEPIVQESTVPPQVALASVVLDQRVSDPGEITNLNITVENIGEAIAEEITLSVSSEYISVEPSEVNIGKLDGGDQQEISFELTGDTNGQRSVTISVESNNAGQDRVLRHLKIRDTEEVAHYLQEIANSENIITDASLTTATEDWRVGNIRLKWLQSAIDAWRNQDPVK